MRPPASSISLLVILALLSCSSSAQAWIKFSKPCPAGCTTYGNCNGELGQCECPYGWAGPTCEEFVLSGCRLNASTKVATLRNMWGTVKSCECLRQINATFTFNVSSLERLIRHHELLRIWSTTVCFERTGLPPIAQHSDIPEDNEQQAWYKATWVHTPSGGYGVLDSLPARPDKIWHWHIPTDYHYFPLQYCPGSCAWRGICIGPSRNTSTCHCWRGFSGQACETEDLPTLMPTVCSGHGRLDGGWCHCSPGFWGVECTRSTAWAPDPSNPLEAAGLAVNRTSPRIYMYDLPWHVVHRTSAIGHRDFVHPALYGIEDHFWRGLVTDQTALTENPYEANLFYVPVANTEYGSNVQVNDDHLLVVMDYLHNMYPHLLSRQHGKDHFMFFLNDHGTCESIIANQGVLANMIKIVHWAPVENHEIAKALRPGTFVRAYTSSCFKPARDVALPGPWEFGLWQLAAGRDTDSFFKDVNSRPGSARKYLAYFGGGYQLHRPYYSGGARQAFHAAFVNDSVRTPPDLKVGGPGIESALQSEFCLIMSGEGWPSTRLGIAVHSGCIPVFIMDFIHQPFHDLLPWGYMSVRLRHEEIPHLMVVLRAIPASHRERMRRTLARHTRTFDWLTPHHRSPYNLTVRSLHKRITDLWGFTYRRL